MIEKMKTVQNPLTVIAIFAALAEVAGTVALATVDKPIQSTFVWFVMAFPTILVVLFFLTLNFNAKVLYAPSDFKDEENFLNTLAGGRVVSHSLEALTKELDSVRNKILLEARKEVGAAQDAERDNLVSVVNRQLELLREKVEMAKESAIETTFAAAQAQVLKCGYCSLVQFRSPESICRRCKKNYDSATASRSDLAMPHPRSELQATMLDYLLQIGRPVTINEIARATKRDAAVLQRAADKLLLRGLIVETADPDGSRLFKHV